MILPIQPRPLTRALNRHKRFFRFSHNPLPSLLCEISPNQPPILCKHRPRQPDSLQASVTDQFYGQKYQRRNHMIRKGDSGIQSG
ncbi:unnamed protein product [Cuscuta europaea]|uniref:Uncharacterized protein n=1 Tax=Cuscuta europaea TaxID=41803 RepID=A0A9P0Z8E5_CUSEU|nr:unnamed protein product [Cuscuta europaea]